ncbi:glutathione S-transferase family protein [Telmatospirillum siberiense]|uniref:Glutathione S-transferase n=1 Tax=Telmatospirillum siberiense TaxID=382514 RepID=A0A2N3PSQ2_9PROT|nr:glutathione S-transferase family protein [Telmatospirillum siberiense]PKU23433.1 glutathione S-transferase [Telmatospirillum siberiense]
MRTLHHQWLDPFSRKVRIALAEKKLAFEMVAENAWEESSDLAALNPACDVPVLVDSNGAVLSDCTAIAEYLDECHLEPPLLGTELLVRAEVRRLVGWFDVKFNRDVTIPLVGEKVFKRQIGIPGGPDSNLLRIGYGAIREHLDYIVWLVERRKWLAGETFSLADITAAAHLSCVDYIGDVPWDAFPQAKDWYARIKSRPSFRPLLSDHLPGIPPPKHYADLDF